MWGDTALSFPGAKVLKPTNHNNKKKDKKRKIQGIFIIQFLCL